MEMTAERLGLPQRGLKLSSLAIGAGPLLALLILFALNSELLIPEKTVQVKPVYYEPVAIVFVSTTSELRDVAFEAEVAAERRAALRAEIDSTVLSVSAKAGQEVQRGDALCRIMPVQEGGEELVLFSPMSGVVSYVNGQPGTTIGAGQPCLTIIDPASLVARGEMTERQAEVILPGDPARLALASGEVASKVRVIYPDTDGNPFNPRPFEVEIGDLSLVAAGQKTKISIETEQVLPILVPFEALTLLPGKGLGVRMVTGQGPTGRIRTMPITLVATADGGFYVDGLPTQARLVIEDEEYTVPVDGTTVRIGRVGG